MYSVALAAEEALQLGGMMHVIGPFCLHFFANGLLLPGSLRMAETRSRTDTRAKPCRFALILYGSKVDQKWISGLSLMTLWIIICHQ